MAKIPVDPLEVKKQSDARLQDCKVPPTPQNIPPQRPGRKAAAMLYVKEHGLTLSETFARTGAGSICQMLVRDELVVGKGGSKGKSRDAALIKYHLSR